MSRAAVCSVCADFSACCSELVDFVISAEVCGRNDSVCGSIE